MKKVILNT